MQVYSSVHSLSLAVFLSAFCVDQVCQHNVNTTCSLTSSTRALVQSTKHQTLASLSLSLSLSIFLSVCLCRVCVPGVTLQAGRSIAVERPQSLRWMERSTRSTARASASWPNSSWRTRLSTSLSSLFSSTS